MTAAAGGAKLAGVTVTAVSPSSRYSATTDKTGFFSMIGVQPDTYNLSYATQGYETFTLSGVTVSQNASVDASTALNKTLRVIGRTQARSSGAAFQPKQTTDQYTVSNTQITQTLGKSNASNESALLASIPGASYDSSGYPVLRGGRENEEGFQYEGIDYTDAFTSQFVNSLTLNGQANFQVTPGAGDASQGNAGTGAINIIAKRGTYPASGSLEADVYGGAGFEHGLHGDYGFATPNGRFSSYSSFFGDRRAPSYGPTGSIGTLIGQFSGRRYQWENDIVNNTVYKFGKDNNQSLQFFYNNTQLDIHLGYGYDFPLPYVNNDKFYLVNTGALSGFSTAQIQALQPWTYGQQSLTDTIGSDGSGRGDENYNQPQQTFKLQYANNINASTYLTAKFYRVNAVALFDFPYIPLNLGFDDQVAQQGGQRTGFAMDGTKQLNAKHLLGFGGKYEFLHPVYDQISGSAAFYQYAGFANGVEALDFLPNDANCPYGPGACGYLLGNNPTGTSYIAPGTKLPYSTEGTASNRQDFAFYVKDTWTPTSALKVDLGLRLDAANYRYPKCDINWCLPTTVGYDAAGNRDPSKDQFNYSSDTRTPRVLEPRAGFSYQLTRNDAFHVNYGRSVTFASLANIDVAGERAFYDAYNKIPSFNNQTGAPAQYCGTTFDVTCANYGEQLYWENQNYTNGVPIQPLKPETFTNWEVGFAHQFPGNTSVKLTPFYRKAFDAFAATKTPLLKNGQPVLDPFGNPLYNPQVQSNNGSSQITGVEFYLTKEATYGLSGSLSLTYQNEFSNVIPGSSSEDFFPSIPPASLALGNKYRVGFLSPFVGALAVQEKTRSGWRINPVIYYNHGYPIGAGLITATTINGKYYNVPNTNVTAPNGSTGATTYVDPRNPGSLFAPNVDATRGTPEGNSAGGVLSAARFGPAQLTIEFTPPSNQKSTFGVLVNNLFNQLYGQPQLNGRYQPIATGIGGPYSGYTSTATVPGYIATYNYTQRNGNQPYLLTQSGLQRSFQFYYQLNF